MRNPCKECEYYHKENNTCQSKKCETGQEGYVTWFDRLFCKPYHNEDRVIWTIDEEGTVKPVIAHFKVR